MGKTKYFMYIIFMHVASFAMSQNDEQVMNYADETSTTASLDLIDAADPSNNNKLIEQLSTYLFKYQNVLLNTRLELECPLTIKSSNVDENNFSLFKFKYILFYKSIHDIDLVEFSAQYRESSVSTHIVNSRFYIQTKDKRVFKKLFKNYKSTTKHVDKWETNKLMLNHTQFSDSGRYYCVYAFKNQHLINGNLFIVHEGKFKSFFNSVFDPFFIRQKKYLIRLILRYFSKNRL